MPLLAQSHDLRLTPSLPCLPRPRKSKTRARRQNSKTRPRPSPVQRTIKSQAAVSSFSFGATRLPKRWLKLASQMYVHTMLSRIGQPTHLAPARAEITQHSHPPFPSSVPALCSSRLSRKWPFCKGKQVAPRAIRSGRRNRLVSPLLACASHLYLVWHIQFIIITQTYQFVVQRESHQLDQPVMGHSSCSEMFQWTALICEAGQNKIMIRALITPQQLDSSSHLCVFLFSQRAGFGRQIQKKKVSTLS